MVCDISAKFQADGTHPRAAPLPNFYLTLPATIKIKMAAITFQQCDGLRLFFFTHTTLSIDFFLNFLYFFRLISIFPIIVLQINFLPIKTDNFYRPLMASDRTL